MTAFKLVAFDVFGTLADGNQHPGPYTRISKELGVDAQRLSRIAQTKELGLGALIDLLAPTKSIDARRATEQKVRADLIEDLAQISLFPEAVTVLSALQARGIKTALVSNLALPYAPRIIDLLQEHGVLPEICIWSFEVGAKKPEVEIYTRLFEQANCTPQEILFVGDKANRDLWPPRELGCTSRLIARPSDRNYAQAIEGINATDRIEDLRDIFSVLNLTPGIEQNGHRLEVPSKKADQAIRP